MSGPITQHTAEVVGKAGMLGGGASAVAGGGWAVIGTHAQAIGAICAMIGVLVALAGFWLAKRSRDRQEAENIKTQRLLQERTALEIQRLKDGQG